MSIRVRFAPSPTGWLHVGGARTALFNYLFAKKHSGSFILRIEDTDQDRHQEESILPLLENLKWLGLNWDEGPLFEKGIYRGPHAPYRQKDRLPIYEEKALQLIEEGKAYYCFMSAEEEALKKAQTIKKGRAWRAISPYRDLPLKAGREKVNQGLKFCVRFKSPERSKSYLIEDLVRGAIRFPADSLGDFILIRTDGFPVYNFSCAVDDGLMQISHIFRGEEHLSNTLKQRLIQEALGFPPPQTGHLSIILGKDKKKLSKRSGAESLNYYQKEGFLPSALINFLALLGWNPGTEQEFFSKKDLIQSFDIKNLNASSAIFDQDKLLWLNEKHLKALNHQEILLLIKSFVKQPGGPEDLKKMIPPLLSGFKTLKQAGEMIELFLDEGFVIHKKSTEPVLKWPKSKILLEKWLIFLRQFKGESLSMQDFKAFQKKAQKEDLIKGKEFFMPLRCALMGRPEGIEIKILISLLKKEQMLKRAEKLLSL